MKLGPALARLHEIETDLAETYRAIGERHPSDHDVYHQCHAFAKQCEHHAQKLAPVAERYGAAVDEDEGPDFWSGVLDRARRTAGAPLGRSAESGLLLLRDLRELFLRAEECSITWVMVAQAAQAARDPQLLEIATECHTEAELHVKWFTTKIKLSAPQVLVAG
jgi:hypothetical protein